MHFRGIRHRKAYRNWTFSFQWAKLGQVPSQSELTQLISDGSSDSPSWTHLTFDPLADNQKKNVGFHQHWKREDRLNIKGVQKSNSISAVCSQRLTDKTSFVKGTRLDWNPGRCFGTWVTTSNREGAPASACCAVLLPPWPRSVFPCLFSLLIKATFSVSRQECLPLRSRWGRERRCVIETDRTWLMPPPGGQNGCKNGLKCFVKLALRLLPDGCSRWLTAVLCSNTHENCFIKQVNLRGGVSDVHWVYRWARNPGSICQTLLLLAPAGGH